MRGKFIGITTMILLMVLLSGCAKKESQQNDSEQQTNQVKVQSSSETSSDDEKVEEKTSDKKEDKEKTTSDESNKDSNKQGNNEVKTKDYSYGGYTLKDNKLDNTRIGWYFSRNKNFTRPAGAKSIEELKKYDAYYIGDNRKVIYLSFDEGQAKSYVVKNLDTLKKHGIKATFFVTKSFIEAHPDVVKRMINEGHVVGNHTTKHLNMNTLATGDNIVNFIKEFADTENKFKEVTGREMTKVFRYPEGAFSEKTLSLTKAMGYRSYFWSFAYKDWEENFNTRDEALNWMKSYYHPGALYLVHGVNKSNSEALDEFLTFMEGQGYTFELLTNIS